MAPNDGDGYTRCAQGHDHWGLYGAAGALLRHVDPQGQERYLLGLRSPQTHGGGCWGVPGGAMDSHENPEQAAMRETQEEFGSLPQIHNVRHIHSNDHGGWAYHTVMGDVAEPWEPEMPADNWETDDARWFTPQEVDELPLHSGFRQTWDQLQRPPRRAASTDISSKEHASRSTRQGSPLFGGNTILATLPEGVKLPEQDTTPEAHVLDSLSLSSVGHNLHYRFEQGGLDPAGAVSYARRLLKMLGYPLDDITVQAAIESWQQLYPQDQVYPAAVNPDKLDKPSVTSATAPLYHWTEARDLEHWMDPSHTGPGETYLTESGDDPATKWNDDIQQMQNPVRIAIDPAHLDPTKFDEAYEGWLGNHLYKGAIPKEAIREIKAFKAPPSWEDGSTLPSEVNNPDDHWPEFGETPPDQHRDLQFSNDF